MKYNGSWSFRKKENIAENLSDDLTIIQKQPAKPPLASMESESVPSDNTVCLKPVSDNTDKFCFNSSQVVQSNNDTSIICTDVERTQISLGNDTGHGINPVKKTETIRISHVIKQRFVLKAILGVGGMGTVYKALDLRKQEAHDKNPYVAIKVLNDEFRNHPESLIALQRESRKSQLLSHPNIVNVYDFDRDDDVVFMTMELLDGKSLDKIIAEDFPHGMANEQAFRIINSVANALSYAHQRGIIHSDLKPSNIFITRDNGAKIFDFGISRACSINKQDGTHDRTLFDPTKLGALTPSYASLQMLQGLAPVPGDDMYSIACVFYELLTGLHPYKRLPADEAQQKRLKPRKISSIRLSKANAINKALEFKVTHRFADIEQFLQAFNQKHWFKRSMIATIVILVFSTTTITFQPVLERYRAHQQQVFMNRVSDNEFAQRDNAVQLIQAHIGTLDDATRRLVLKQIKHHYLTLLKLKINRLINAGEQNHLYDQASAILTRAQVHYPDSAKIARMFAALEQKKFIKLNELNNRFNELLEIAHIANFDEPGQERDFQVVIEQVKLIDPNHTLVNDKRLLIIFQDSIQWYIQKNNINRAEQLLMSAQTIFINDFTLKNLAVKIAALDHNNKQANSKEQLSSEINVPITELKKQFSMLLEQTETDKDWEYKVNDLYLQLAQKMGRKSRWLNRNKQLLAAKYLQKSVAMREQQLFMAARRYLDQAKTYHKTLFGIDDERAILDAMETMVDAKQKARQRQATIVGLKSTLMTQLKALQMDSALRTYKKLQRTLGHNDKFISGEARLAMANAYYQRAKYYIAEKKYALSLDMVANGLTFERHHSGMKNIRKKARKQIKLINESRLLAQKLDDQKQPQ